jgi:PAS domain-containing protein
MTSDLLRDVDYARVAFDAMPSPAFVVDNDVRILDANRAALPFVGEKPALVFHKRGGDVLKCIQAVKAAGGCGTAEACKQCVIRNSVGKAASGQEIVRASAEVNLVADDEVLPLHLLITATPIPRRGSTLVLLILEDITELTELQHILPLCTHCKQRRNDDAYWKQVVNYLTNHTHLTMSQSLCPDCARQLYPDLNEERSA